MSILTTCDTQHVYVVHFAGFAGVDHGVQHRKSVGSVLGVAIEIKRHSQRRRQNSLAALSHVHTEDHHFIHGRLRPSMRLFSNISVIPHAARVCPYGRGMALNLSPHGHSARNGHPFGPFVSSSGMMLPAHGHDYNQAKTPFPVQFPASCLNALA